VKVGKPRNPYQGRGEGVKHGLKRGTVSRKKKKWGDGNKKGKSQLKTGGGKRFGEEKQKVAGKGQEREKRFEEA